MPRKSCCRFIVAAFACVLAVPAGAQRLPVVGAPMGQALPTVERVLQTPEQAIDGVRRLAASSTDVAIGPLLDYADASRRLLRRHSDLLDTDPDGRLVLRHQLVAIAPTSDALARILAAGFEQIGESRNDELGLHSVVLRTPSGVDARAAMTLLRRLDPSGDYAFDHVYLRSGGTVAPVATAAASATAQADPRAVRVGLVDGGVDARHPALAKVDTHAWGCDGKRVPDAHGTAVASLLMGASREQAGGGTLYAADLWCGHPVGGASSALVDALAWLARERVATINLSLVGPDNALLRRATQALVARGYVLVAAVGNDGPAAAPLYPAAYPGVIGVSALDRRGRVLPEAGRGRQVDFAAAGSRLRAAGRNGDWAEVRGTSYAAPLVAHLAALQAQQPRAGNPEAVQQALARMARDAGPVGRDDSYGFGVLETD